MPRLTGMPCLTGLSRLACKPRRRDVARRRRVTLFIGAPRPARVPRCISRSHSTRGSDLGGLSRPCAVEERGSVLVMVPAAVLILVILGSIAVDSGATFLGQRELAQAAQTAAENATDEVSPGSFYGSGTIELDPTRATQVADASVAAQVLSGVELDGPVRVQVAGQQVCVTLSGRVPVIFGSVLPGVARWTAVSAHSTATAAGTLSPNRVPTTALCS